MKKKLLVILVLISSVFITGCTVDYNLDFSDSEMKEVININLDSSESTEKNIDIMHYSAENEAAAVVYGGSIKKYNFSENQTSKGYTGIFSYNYSPEDFNHAYLLRSCYDSFNFVQTEDGYYLVTSDTFRCGYFSYMKVDKYTLTITSNHKVIENNADRVENNKYIWEVTPNGKVSINKPLKIVFSNETIKEQVINGLDENSKLVTYIVIGVIGCVILVVSIIFIIKRKKNGN